MDTYETMRAQVQEEFEKTLHELYLLKLSHESSDKAVKNRLQDEVQDLRQQLSELNRILEDLGHEMDAISGDVH
jgi:DNA repair exonuclease SbcCD ATPase subunit